ncbi:MAG: sarcosine oxidase subunit gamma [Cognatishimia sp.]
MLEPKSPLSKYLVPTMVGAQGDDSLCLSERPISSLWQIAGWADFDAAAKSVLTKLGVQSGDYRHKGAQGDVSCYRVAPDRILIEGCQNLDEFAAENLVVLDLSHARTVICISGAQARTALAKLCAVDTSAEAFQPGQFIQTGMHHIAVLMQCLSDEEFEIQLPGTWAVSLWEAICFNAEPFGYEVKVNRV